MNVQEYFTVIRNMSDFKYDRPEAPSSWDQYARMLKDLPAHDAPADLLSRIDSRLDRPNPARFSRPAVKWVLVPTVAATALLGILLVTNHGNQAPINQKQIVRPIVNDSLTAGSRNARRNVRRIAPPLIQSDTAVQIDTSIPTAIPASPTEDPIVPGIRPAPNRQVHPTEVTTGGPRR